MLQLVGVKMLLPHVMGNGVCLSAPLQSPWCGELLHRLVCMCGRMTSLVNGRL